MDPLAGMYGKYKRPQNSVSEILSNGVLPVALWPPPAAARWWTECPLSAPWLCDCWCSLAHSAQLEIKEEERPIRDVSWLLRTSPLLSTFSLTSPANTSWEKRPTLCLHKVPLSSVTSKLLFTPTLALLNVAYFANVAEIREKWSLFSPGGSWSHLLFGDLSVYFGM